MMIGTLIESNIWPNYLLTVFLVVIGFAVYDVLCQRVPDRALAFFIPLAALAPIVKGYPVFDYGQTPWLVCPIVAESVIGALMGFSIPLAAAIATGGNGIGGGDIKFCGVLGLVYGPSGMAMVFLIASGIAIPVVLMFRRFFRDTQPVSIPFLPFLACGCSVATLAQLLR